MSKAGRSWWESELFDQEYDLIIIGAGLTGQSAALFYKRMNPGARILVLERGFVPVGASTRNAGFACFGSPTEHLDDMNLEDEHKIIDRIGRRMRGLQLLRDTLGDENIDYREDGAFEIFTDAKTFKDTVKHLDQLNEWVKRASGQDETYLKDEYAGYKAISIKGEGSLHPAKMMSTLYKRNLELNIEYHWNSPVDAINIKAGRIQLNGGIELKATKTLIAANAFSTELLPEISIRPCRGMIFVTRPINDLKWKGTFHYDKGFYYFRNIGDRLLVGGARNKDEDKEFTAEFGINTKIKEELIRFTTEVLGMKDHWEIESQWSGIMGFTPTKSPCLKKLNNNTIIAAGLSGMGVALGMQLGNEAADELTGL